MKKIVKGLPCTKCQKLENGSVISTEKVLGSFTRIKYTMDNCKTEHTEVWSEKEINRYVKEVPNVET